MFRLVACLQQGLFGSEGGVWQVECSGYFVYHWLFNSSQGVLDHLNLVSAITYNIYASLFMPQALVVHIRRYLVQLLLEELFYTPELWFQFYLVPPYEK